MNKTNKAKPNNSMYMFWSIAIVICLILVIFALILSSISYANPTPRGTNIPSSASPDTGSETSPDTVSPDADSFGDPSTPPSDSVGSD